MGVVSFTAQAYTLHQPGRWWKRWRPLVAVGCVGEAVASDAGVRFRPRFFPGMRVVDRAIINRASWRSYIVHSKAPALAGQYDKADEEVKTACQQSMR
jgi:hypothetical protein